MDPGDAEPVGNDLNGVDPSGDDPSPEDRDDPDGAAFLADLDSPQQR